MKTHELIERLLKSRWLDSEQRQEFRRLYEIAIAKRVVSLDPLLEKIEAEICWKQQFRAPRDPEDDQ